MSPVAEVQISADVPLDVCCDLARAAVIQLGGMHSGIKIVLQEDKILHNVRLGGEPASDIIRRKACRAGKDALLGQKRSHRKSFPSFGEDDPLATLRRDLEGIFPVSMIVFVWR